VRTSPWRTAGSRRNYAIAVVGVDASAESIKLAHSTFGTRVKFIHQTAEGHAKRNVAAYDLAIANMVLMDVLDLELFLSALHRMLRPDGVLIFSITHPCFWPQYYGYDREQWYRYDRELIIEAPFRITNAPDCPFLSTHIHRPLQSYMTALRRAGFGVDELCEPMPPQEIEVLYQSPWTSPRYLIGSCHKTPQTLLISSEPDTFTTRSIEERGSRD
jgi:SAM-dependent methyltransferase